jgi:hypothetical protein
MFRPSTCTCSLLFALTLAACGQPSLGDIEVPEGFSFDTTVGLEVAIEPKQPPETPSSEAFRGVEVSRANGDLLYRGSVSRDRPLVVNLGLPLADREVRLTLMSEVERVERVLPVVDGVVHAEIR